MTIKSNELVPSVWFDIFTVGFKFDDELFQIWPDRSESFQDWQYLPEQLNANLFFDRNESMCSLTTAVSRSKRINRKNDAGISMNKKDHSVLFIDVLRKQMDKSSKYITSYNIELHFILEVEMASSSLSSHPRW